MQTVSAFTSHISLVSELSSSSLGSFFSPAKGPNFSPFKTNRGINVKREVFSKTQSQPKWITQKHDSLATPAVEGSPRHDFWSVDKCGMACGLAYSLMWHVNASLSTGRSCFWSSQGAWSKCSSWCIHVHLQFYTHSHDDTSPLTHEPTPPIQTLHVCQQRGKCL